MSVPQGTAEDLHTRSAVSPHPPLSPAERSELLLHIESGRLIVQTPDEAEDWYRRRRLEEAMSEALETRAMSGNIPALNAALAAAQGEFPPIGKSKSAQGTKFSYDYADLADVLAAVRPVLSRHGLAITQATNEHGHLITELRHADGGVLSSSLQLKPTDDWQQFGSGLSYARRYAICARLGIQPADEDDDGAGSQQKGSGASANGKPDAPEMISKDQHAKIGALVGELTKKWPGPSWADRLREEFHVRSRKELSQAQASKAIDWLQQHVDHVPELKGIE